MEGDKTAEISDTADQHRTPARSNTTHYRSVWEATRCAALFYGLTKNQLKQFSFQMRVDMLKKVEEDLLAFGNPLWPPFVGYSLRPSRTLLQALEQVLNGADGNNLQVSPAEGGSSSNINLPTTTTLTTSTAATLPIGSNQIATLLQRTQVVGLYFSTSAPDCAPCQQFAPMINAFYENVRRKHGAGFEIIFVSADRDEASFDLYQATMPWPAVPFRHQDLIQELSAEVERGEPTLVLFRAGGWICSKVVDGRGGRPKLQIFPFPVVS